MAKRQCENCLYFTRLLRESVGECRIRSVPHDDFPRRNIEDFCGEWKDAAFTHEQHDRKDLTRRFAVALMHDLAAQKLYFPTDVWKSAGRLADFEREH